MTEDLSIFQEIDESLKAEKLEKFLSTHGNLLIIICVGIVLAVAFSGWWKNHVKEENASQTSILVQASELADAKKYDEAIAKLQEVEKSSSNIAGIAKLRHAEILIVENKFEQALGLYKEIFSGSGDKALRDLAAINAEIIANNHNLPHPPQNSYETRPFNNFASELYAINLLNQSKNKDAKAALEAVSSKEDLPNSQKQRTTELLDYIKGSKQ